MRVFASITLVVCFLMSSSSAQAAWWNKKKESSAPVEQKDTGPAVKPTEAKPKEIPQQPAADAKALEAQRQVQRELIEQKRRQMDNCVWEVQMIPLTGKGKKTSETITFKDRQVSFESLGKSGFTASNYSVKIQRDNTLVWETMQTSEKNGVFFCRGEIAPDGASMRGIASRVVNDKSKEEFSFVSSLKNPIVREAAAEK